VIDRAGLTVEPTFRVNCPIFILELLLRAARGETVPRLVRGPGALKLHDIDAPSVAAYVEQLGSRTAKPTVKQHLAAIKQLFAYLTSGGILEVNPAASVRGAIGGGARQLLDSIESSTLIGLRDRTLIGMMVYSFAQVGAAVAMKGGDLFQHRKQLWLRLHEKGGKRHEVPCHPELEAYLTAWTKAAGIGRDKKGPLFRSVGKGERLSEKAMSRFDVFHMIKRRAKAAGLPYSTCCHTFRATGITAYLENGGTLEHAQTIANHESPRTTKLYDRTREELTAEEIGDFRSIVCAPGARRSAGVNRL